MKHEISYQSHIIFYPLKNIMKMKLGASILALLLSSSAQAANIDIEQSIQEYEDTTAQVGDTITFTWSSTHNVYMHPSGTCDSEGAILIGETSPVTYTFTADDVDEDLFFICGIPGHCDAGQTITVSVTEAGDATTPESVEPSSVPMVPGSDAPAPTAGSAATSVPMAAGLASATLAMALAWFIE